jgi:hypothetical protein
VIPNHERPQLDQDVLDRLQKPAKGSGYVERKTKRKAIVTAEDTEKDKVRARDGRCRWPFCENCRRYKPRLEVAHIDPKGMGGDHGVRSDASQMILLDWLTHQSGPASLEQHGRRIVPLTKAGTAGPCDFYATDADGRLYLVAREIAPFFYERD